MRAKILITDKVHDHLISTLKDAGFTVDYFPLMSYRDVRKISPGYDGLVINSKVICDDTFLKENKHLHFIGRLGSGLDMIDLPAASKMNIEIISSPEGNAGAVAEHVMGMLLNLLNNICLANSEVKEFNWIREANRGVSLKGKKIGIIGLGNTGGALAKRLKNWDVHIFAYDKYRKDINEAFPHVRSVDMDFLLSSCDIISVHLPLTAETNNLINASLLRTIKKGAVLINTSRGRIINLNDLVISLKEGNLAGACLDVLENENFDSLSGHEKNIYKILFAMPNVILTPHIAGWTHESLYEIAEILGEKILKFYRK